MRRSHLTRKELDKYYEPLRRASAGAKRRSPGQSSKSLIKKAHSAANAARRKKASKTSGTVRVKGFTRKDGVKVKGYTRKK